jgi:hypothetical protein
VTKSKTAVKMVCAAETALFDSVANAFETKLPHVIEDWLSRVQLCSELTCIPLNFEERTGYLSRLLRDVIARLRQGVDSQIRFRPLRASKRNCAISNAGT